MAVLRWNDPFRDLATLQERMNRVFEDALTRGTPARSDEEMFTGTWAPPVDIFETKDRVVLNAELPGFTDDQIQLRFEDGVLSIEGERKLDKKGGDENYHRVERSYGRFVRTFSIPTNVDHERISASFVNGVLTVVLPKREETKPKQIRIHATGATPAIDIAKS